MFKGRCLKAGFKVLPHGQPKDQRLFSGKPSPVSRCCESRAVHGEQTRRLVNRPSE